MKKKVFATVCISTLLLTATVVKATTTLCSVSYGMWNKDSSYFTSPKNCTGTLRASTSNGVTHRVKKVIPKRPDKSVFQVKGSGTATGQLNMYNDDGVRQSYYISVDVPFYATKGGGSASVTIP